MDNEAQPLVGWIVDPRVRPWGSELSTGPTTPVNAVCASKVAQRSHLVSSMCQLAIVVVVDVSSWLSC